MEINQERFGMLLVVLGIIGLIIRFIYPFLCWIGIGLGLVLYLTSKD